jgi:hypothetical protein
VIGLLRGEFFRFDGICHAGSFSFRGMKQPDARTGEPHYNRMIGGFQRIGTGREAAGAVPAGSHSVTAAEGAAEDLMTFESAAERYLKHGIPLGKQHHRGHIDAEAQRELLGRLPEHLHKQTVQMKGRHFGADGQGRQREVAIRMRGHKCNQRLNARERASRHCLIVGRNFPAFLTILAANRQIRSR